MMDWSIYAEWQTWVAIAGWLTFFSAFIAVNCALWISLYAKAQGEPVTRALVLEWFHIADDKKSAGATHPEGQRIPLTKGMNHIIEGGTVEVYSPDGELYARYDCGPVERETTWQLVVPDNGYYAVQV